MMYPDKKQLNKKKEDLARCLRHFHLGFATPQMVKNELQCLFTDTQLEMMNLKASDKVDFPNMNFKQMLAKW